MGQNTQEFKAHKNASLEERAFSILYVDRGKHKSLNLVAPSQELCLQWVTCLHILMSQKDSIQRRDMIGLPAWIQGMWQSIDIKKQGYLDLDQVTILMRKLNFQLSKREIKSNIKV